MGTVGEGSCRGKCRKASSKGAGIRCLCYCGVWVSSCIILPGALCHASYSSLHKSREHSGLRHPSASPWLFLPNYGCWTWKAHRSCRERKRGGKDDYQMYYLFDLFFREGGSGKGRRRTEQPIKESSGASLFNKKNT